MGSKRFDKYCEDLYNEWLEDEANDHQIILEEVREAEKDDEKYENALRRIEENNHGNEI